jgi:hypothetical protein
MNRDQHEWIAWAAVAALIVTIIAVIVLADPTCIDPQTGATFRC